MALARPRADGAARIDTVARRLVQGLREHWGPTRLLGRLAFAVPALRCTWNLAPTGTTVAVDGEETEHALLFALAIVVTPVLLPFIFMAELSKVLAPVTL